MKLILDERLLLREADEVTDATKTLVIARLDDTITTASSTVSTISTYTDILSKILEAIENTAKIDFDLLSKIDKRIADNQLWNNRQEVLNEITAYINEEEKLLTALAKVTEETVKIERPESSLASIQTINKNIQSALNKLKELKKIVDKASSIKQTDERVSLLLLLQKKFEELQKIIKETNINQISRILIRRQDIDNLVKKLKESLPKIFSKIDEIKTLKETNIDWITAEIETKVLKFLVEAKNTLSDTLEKAKTYTDIKFEDIANTEETKTQLLNLSTTADELFEKLDKEYTTLSTWIKSWKAEAAVIGSEAGKEEVTDWPSAFKQAYLTDLKSNKTMATNSKSAIDQVWDRYYQEVWHTDSDDSVKKLLASIHKPFNKEISNLGYTADQNPFVAFLQTMKDDPVFKESIIADPTKYSYIHNAYISDYLSDEDLFGKGKLKTNNIIFNPEFYKLNAGTLTTYLYIQKMVEVIYTTNTTPFRTFVSDAVDGTNLLNTKYGNKIVEFITDLCYKNGNVIVNSLARSEGDPTKGFNSIENINKAISICFTNETVTSAKKAITSSTDKQELLDITSSNLEEAIKHIIKITTTVEHLGNFIDAILQLNKALPRADIDKYRKDYNIPERTLTETELKKVLTTGCTKYNITKTLKIEQAAIYRQLIEALCTKYKEYKEAEKK